MARPLGVRRGATRGGGRTLILARRTHPEPARRWLTHAVEPGVLLVDAVELRMRGEIRLGRRWAPFTATEHLVPDSGFVWAAHSGVARLPLSGYDVAPDGTLLGAAMRRWGDPNGTGFAEQGFEVNFAAEHSVSGISLPDDMRACWVDAQGLRQEFFHAVLDSADFCTG